MFRRAFARHQQKNWLERDYDLASLRFLADDLELIREHRPSLFAHLRDRITKVKPGNRCEYYGERYELFLAALLLSKGIDFTKPASESSGDFFISTGSHSHVWEATTVCLEKHLPGSKRFGYKVARAITKKAGKTIYALPSSALFIDVSQATFHEIPRDGTPAGFDPFWSQALNEGRWLSNKIRGSGFGSVILTQYVVLDDDPHLEPETDFVYSRYDNPNIDPGLEALLDLHFAHVSFYLPRGKHGVVIAADA